MRFSHNRNNFYYIEESFLELDSIAEDISEVILQGYKGNLYSIALFVDSAADQSSSSKGFSTTFLNSLIHSAPTAPSTTLWSKDPVTTI